MKNLLKEPLIHFLLFGLILFGIFSLTADNEQDNITITLSEAKKAQLVFSFEKTYQRKPSEQELAVLINNNYKMQVASQKGIEMGLLDGDEVIQRRIQQKVEFIVEEVANSLNPSDEELKAFLEANRENYLSDQLFSFQHVYLDPLKHQNFRVKQDETLVKVNKIDNFNSGSAQENLTKADEKKKTNQLMSLSDDIFLEYQYSNISHALVTRNFGSQFAETLQTMPLGNWLQDVKSGYGKHIVKLTIREGGEFQALDEVKYQVKKDWLIEQRTLNLASFYKQLFEEYSVDTREFNRVSH